MPLTPIRPPLTPPISPAPRTQSAQAAQRAFFEIAASKAPSGPAAASAAAPAPAPSGVRTPAAEPPSRILRPGSLLNIRV